MKPTIHLAFVDDWELSGNGSGDIRELQFRPMRELVKIYNARKRRLTGRRYYVMSKLFQSVAQNLIMAKN